MANITITHPELAKQWHPTKNGDFRAENFTFGSEKKVWWLCPNIICKEGCIHEYIMMVCNRVKGNGCKFCCIPRKQHCIHESISHTHPELVKQWHPTENGVLKPEDFTMGSHKEITWVCENKCDFSCSHIWKAEIKTRVRGSGCPYCSTPAKQFCKHNSLAYINPELEKQWHPTKNGDLKAEHFSVCSGEKVWWYCNKSCEYGCKHGGWESRIASRTNGGGCPYCCKQLLPCKHESIEYKYPELLKQWHPTKNGDLNPNELSVSSPVKVWWLCQETCNYGCLHEWEAVVYSRTINNSGCPFCCYNTLQLCIHDSIVYTHPEILKQWHPTKNGELTPEQFSAGSNKDAWFYKICDIGGCVHEWHSCIANITNRNVNNGPTSVLCIHESLSYLHPKIAKQWHPTKNGELTPEQITSGSGLKVWWLCDKKHNFQSRVANRTILNRGCPYCVNKTEQKLYDALIKHYPQLNQQFKVEWCKNITYLPFDFVLAEDKIIIELDGLQHFEQVSNWQSPEETHLNDVYKMKCANDNGYSVIRLLQTDVFYDTYDWLKELRENIEKIKLERIIKNIYMCKDNEYAIFA